MTPENYLRLEKRLTQSRRDELVKILGQLKKRPGRPSHYLGMLLKGYAENGQRAARWKDDQEVVLEQVESHARSLVTASRKLVHPYNSKKIHDLMAEVENLAAQTRREIENASRLNTTPWPEDQAVAILIFYLQWAVAVPKATPTGAAYKFLFRCLATLTGTHPSEDGRGGVRGLYRRALPRAKLEFERLEGGNFYP